MGRKHKKKMSSHIHMKRSFDSDPRFFLSKKDYSPRAYFPPTGTASTNSPPHVHTYIHTRTSTMVKTCSAFCRTKGDSGCPQLSSSSRVDGSFLAMRSITGKGMTYPVDSSSDLATASLANQAVENPQTPKMVHSICFVIFTLT